MRQERYKCGDIVGRLTLLEKLRPEGKDKHSRWLCRCSCGVETVVSHNNLARQRQCKKCGAAINKTHGMSDTGLYEAWSHMKQRCLNPNDRNYHNYGGRGIAVCDEWMAFDPFKEWSLKNGYSPSLSLDRIDNDKGYYPENCRWADRKTQTNNRRNTIYITAYGKTLPCAEWARKTGIPTNTLRGRIMSGWTSEDAVSKPVKRKHEGSDRY